MARTLLPEAGGLAWGLWDTLVEVLALPIGLIVMPFVAVGRAAAHVHARNTVSDFAREVAITRKKLRLASRCAQDYLRENLNGLQEIERIYLQQRYRSVEDARRAADLLTLARRRLIDGAREAAGTQSAVGVEAHTDTNEPIVEVDKRHNHTPTAA